MLRKMNIWGRKFTIEVIYDAYEGEAILSSQIEALNRFVSVSNDLLSDPAQVIKYCLANNPKEITEPVDNIFKYVIPTSLYIKRSPENNIVLLCDYKFDYEHGIALIFDKNELIEVCSQSKI